MTNKNVLVIGCGNMPQALLKHHKDFNFLTYTPSQKRAISLAQQLHGEHIKSLETLDWTRVDIILLACKPQQVESLSKQIKQDLNEEILIISMLAGINLKTQQRLMNHQNLIRIMPNITSQVGKGSLLVYPKLNDINRDNFSFLEMQATLYSTQTEEIFDQLMLVTGSGPAYIFYLIRSFERHLEGLGLPSDDYKQAIQDTFSGALDIMQEHKSLNTTELIEKVASKGGVTEEALAFFDNNNFDNMIDNAMKAGVLKSQQLQKNLSTSDN